MKKFLAMLLAMVMVMGMSLMTFAAEVEVPSTPLTPPSHTPTKNDVAKAEVENVEAGATVTAYRIVEPTYNDKGFTGYKVAEGVTLVDMLKPTSDEVTGIAANKDLLTTLTSKELSAPEGAAGLTTYTGALEAGYWVVVVKGSEIQEVYNPMLIGIYYRVEGSGDDNTLVNGTVDANSKWSLNSTPAYAKSEQPTIDKKITGSTGKNTSDGNESGNDVAIGDTVKFEIDTKIPSYSKSYTNVTVKIKDQMGKGLTLADPANLVVKVNDVEVEAGDGTFTYTEADDKKSFEISFVSAYALAHSGEAVVVTYDAVLGEDAGLNFDANDNTAKLEYTNDPSGETNEIEDKTYTYTFGIDAALNGSDSEKTQELYKLDENGTAIVEGETITVTNPLAGAKFRLQKKNDDGNLDETHIYEATSADDGSLSFTGLDAGTYVLVETEAPEGYSLDPTEHEVVITAKYYSEPKEDEGKLESYTITIDSKATSTYEATYDSINGTKVTTIDKTELGVTGIKNTKLASLPSTGGIGTTIFTVGGCAIMIIAAGLYFATRRKSAK